MMQYKGEEKEKGKHFIFGELVSWLYASYYYIFHYFSIFVGIAPYMGELVVREGR